MLLLYFLLSLITVSSFSQEVILVEDFNSYKDTSDFLDTWKSRVDGYKKVLKENPYYYYLRPDPFEKNKKCLCSSLRMLPKDFERKDIDTSKIDLSSNDKHIKSVSIYKDYWLKKIKAGDFHKAGKKVFLEWEWLANKLPEGALEVKDKDDHAIAVYVVVYVGWMRFRTIKYVWSSTDQTGLVPGDLVDDQNKMVRIVSNNKTPLGKWVHVSVDVSEDMKKFLPSHYEDLSIAGIAVLSNTDNLKKPSEACIKDIKILVEAEK